MSFSGYRIAFPIIRVKDKYDGYIHIIGTDSHDSLYIGDDGQLHYYNLQCGDGTGPGDDYGYEFVADENGSHPLPNVEFVGMDRLIEIVTAHANLSAERERILRAMFASAWKDFDEETEKNAQQGLIHS